MNGYVYCKVCGYVTEEAHLGDVCPACGVPKTAFAPREDKISAQRRRILKRHFHSMVIHFPQALSIIICFLLLTTFWITSIYSTELMAAVRVMAVLFPLSTLVTIITGMIDGKARFKKRTTPLLKLKIRLGFILFLTSLLLAVLLLAVEFLLIWKLLLSLLVLVSAAISTVLGDTGGKLVCLLVPGK